MFSWIYNWLVSAWNYFYFKAFARSNKLQGIFNDKKEEVKPIVFPTIPTIELPKVYDEIKQDYFTKDFDIEQDNPKDILDFFETYGLVVFRNILTEDEIEENKRTIWSEILEQKQVSRFNPKTWIARLGWPDYGNVGIVGNSCYWNRKGMENRQNEKLVKCFELIYGMDKTKLWSSVDRLGVIRPTKNVPIPYNDIESLSKDKVNDVQSTQTVSDFEEYKTSKQWLHWDLNPYDVIEGEEENGHLKLLEQKYKLVEGDYESYFITENNNNFKTLRLQGILTFTEARERDGGFCCVPGFHRHVVDYCKALVDLKPSSSRANMVSFWNVPRNDNLCKQSQKVPVKAGCIIIFNSYLPHCNYPNESERFRMVQYLKMIPKKGDLSFQQARAKVIKQNMDVNFVPNETGMEVLGLNTL
ncbi:hypothetical protein ABK040_007489 [Willaertia magna]